MPTLPTNAMTRLGNWFWPNHYGSGDANGSWPEQWAIDVNQSPDASDFSRITSGTPAWGAGDTIGSSIPGRFTTLTVLTSKTMISRLRRPTKPLMCWVVLTV